MKKNNKGFTLVEVLAVITLIGVLLILLVPTVYRVLNTTRSAIKDLEKTTLIDAGKLYAEHIYNGADDIESKKVFDSSCNVVRVDTVQKPASYLAGGVEISGYDLVKYASLNDLYVSVGYLVEHGYYDNDCDYDADGVCTFSSNCKVDPNCQLKIHFEHTTIKANPSCNLGDDCMVYYQLGASTVSFAEGQPAGICDIK